MTLTRSPQPDQAGKGPGDRRTLIVLVGLVLLVGLGGIGYLLLPAADDDGATVETTPAVTRSATAGVTGAPGTASGSPGPSGSATAPAGGTSTAAAGSRNPFAGSAAAVPGGVAPTAATSATSTTGSTTTSVPTSAPLVTTFVTTTRTATRTVTTTVAGVYLGLYGWTDDGRPMFRVNETSSTPTAGTTFATSLVYVGSVEQDTRTCANVTFGGVANSLCPGDVLKLS